jgi:hypothetical protein
LCFSPSRSPSIHSADFRCHRPVMARVNHAILPPTARLSPIPGHLVRNYDWKNMRPLRNASQVSQLTKSKSESTMDARRKQVSKRFPGAERRARGSGSQTISATFIMPPGMTGTRRCEPVSAFNSSVIPLRADPRCSPYIHATLRPAPQSGAGSFAEAVSGNRRILCSLAGGSSLKESD